MCFACEWGLDPGLTDMLVSPPAWMGGESRGVVEPGVQWKSRGVGQPDGQDQVGPRWDQVRRDQGRQSQDGQALVAIGYGLTKDVFHLPMPKSSILFLPVNQFGGHI